MEKHAIVLGMGMSGKAAAGLLIRHGWSVTIADRAAIDPLGCDLLLSDGVHILSSIEKLPDDNFDLCVVSPGIDQYSPWVIEMEQRNIEVVSELELGFRYCRCPVVAVTGTNGKSTLVKLLLDIFSAAGLSAEIAGNYGIPLCEVAERSKSLDWVLVEVSSFQLEKVSTFQPKVGVLLNLQPDHLNRHGGMKEYRELKSRLFRCMGEGDVGIIHFDEVPSIRELIKGKKRWVSFGKTTQADVYYAGDGKIILNRGRVVDIGQSEFDNPILGQTAAAAAVVMDTCGIELGYLTEVLASFNSLAHRMQKVAIIEDVFFVDDSKATNLAALKAGLEMSDRPVRLIAGGMIKEKNVKFVKEVLANKAVCVYVIGDAANKLKAGWGDTVDCVHCGDLQTAVKKAWKDSSRGDTILLSPGCASFDQFESYKDRGEQFIKVVEEINDEKRDEKSVSD